MITSGCRKEICLVLRWDYHFTLWKPGANKDGKAWIETNLYLRSTVREYQVRGRLTCIFFPLYFGIYVNAAWTEYCWTGNTSQQPSSRSPCCCTAGTGYIYTHEVFTSHSVNQANKPAFSLLTLLPHPVYYKVSFGLMRRCACCAHNFQLDQCQQNLTCRLWSTAADAGTWSQVENNKFVVQPPGNCDYYQQWVEILCNLLWRPGHMVAAGDFNSGLNLFNLLCPEIYISPFWLGSSG